MTTYDAYELDNAVLYAKLQTGTISGTVTKSAAGVKRQILVYKNLDNDVHAIGWSDPSTGDYSIAISGSALDKFRVIAVGVEGENDEIFGSVASIND